MSICFIALVYMLSAPIYGQPPNAPQTNQPSRAPQEVNAAQGDNYSVKVKSVIARSSPADNKVVYEINYGYEFKGRDSVYVKGIGIVPAKRDGVSYLTSETELEFRESAGGAVIVSVPLQETIVTQGGGVTELPQETEFSTAFRTGVWKRPVTFHENASRVIGKYFPFGYVARNKEQVNYYVTTYRNLVIPGGTLRSQISVMVSQPYDSGANGFTYRVQFVVRDRPRMSTTWRIGEQVSEQTKTAVAEFINNLINELSAGDKR
jgi:hypothetical protein